MSFIVPLPVPAVKRVGVQWRAATCRAAHRIPRYAAILPLHVTATRKHVGFNGVLGGAR